MVKVTTISDIDNNIDNVKKDVTDLETRIHKQEKKHYNYVQSNNTYVSEIEQQLRTEEEFTRKLEEGITRNSICIKILCAGLLSAGIAILALIYHILTI